MSLRHVLWRRWRRLWGVKTLGQRGEAAAARFLRRKGYKLLARSHRFGPGELDLVMLDGETIVFVEVKTRRAPEPEQSLAAVDRRKQQKLTRLALAFLRRHALLAHPARFDVVAVCWPKGRWFPQISHVKDAFQAADFS